MLYSMFWFRTLYACRDYDHLNRYLNRLIELDGGGATVEAPKEELDLAATTMKAMHGGTRGPADLKIIQPGEMPTAGVMQTA